MVAPPPGGPAQLARISDALAAQRLDRRKPLWELTLVDGLADGSQGLIIRLHHALMDGPPTIEALSRLLSGEDHEPARPADPWVPDTVPTRRQLLRAALADHKGTVKRLPALVGVTRRGVKAQKEFEAQLGFTLPKTVRDTPPVLTNHFTARRRHANLTFPMADVLAVKRAAGVTVTHAMLAVSAGGLRRYLLGRGELPDRPLIAGVPMAYNPPGPPREWGNHFINFTTSLATDIADPWDRLMAIDTVTTAAEESMAAFDGELLCDWMDELPPFFTRWSVKRLIRSRQRKPQKADINVNVSVVRGPREPWTLGPAMVEDFYMEGPPNSGCGISVTAFNYVDRMSVGISCNADAVPDPEVLADCFAESMAELVARAAARPAEAQGLAS